MIISYPYQLRNEVNIAQIAIHVRQEIADFIYRKADEHSMSPEAYAASVLTNAILALSPDVPDQLAAEAKYWDVLRAILERLVESDDWGPDITKRVFEEIERRHRALYERAINSDAYATGNPTKARINIETASRIKTALKAEARLTSGGSPVRGKVSKGIISAYSKLYRPGRKGAR